ncbi:MAG: RluA family pseudouridine synthase [Oscillospiraceae bacterium]|jgi:23S rRNA pseudouridine955/2504/2580 synthase|nr:RluA family pseudouridine synthase [Oscillospiraceae bacterium]
MKELIITKNDAGQRVDRFLSKAVPLLPEALLQKYIRLKRVKLDGRAAKRDEKLREGAVLRLYINDEFFETPSPDNAYLKINTPRLILVYEDDNILIADKRPGVLSHAGDGIFEDTLIDNIKAYLYQNGQWKPRDEHSFAPALANRIDRNTGGLVLAAKNAEALRILNEKLKAREISKYYLCAVLGAPEPPEGILRGYIFKDAVKNRVYVKNSPEPGAKLASTRYRTLKTLDGLSLLECELLTGRTHQIRAQLATAGTPLLGDGKYGSEKQNRAFGQKGQALYSYKLRFDFTADAGILNYLRGKELRVSEVPFAENIFSLRIVDI